MINVRQSSAAVDAMAVHWPLIEALLGGSEAMRRKGTLYLPKQPREDALDWEYRLNTATLYPAFERTVEVLAGKPFSRPLVVKENVPARMVPWLDTVDLRRNLHVFAASLMEDALAFGLAGILVDYPRAEGLRTAADEAAAGVRPYFVHVRANQILGWRSQVIGGREELTQLRLLETVEEEDGDFGTISIEQVRVLFPGGWQIWRMATDTSSNKGWKVYDEGVTTLNKIPFVPVYGKYVGFMRGKPPLLSLAEQNKDHWRESSDQRDSVRFARKRLLVLIGANTEDDIVAGSNYAINLPENADAKIVQGSAEAVEIGRKEIDTLEEQMRQSGAEMLVIRPGNITATQTASEDAGNLCALQRIALDLEDSLDQALQFMAEWIGEKSGGNVELFKDFAAASMDAATAELLLKTNQAGKLSDETLLAEYQRRGIVSTDVSFEDEATRIANQAPNLNIMAGDPGIAAPVAA
jgi:hypothetical protein